MLMKKYIIPLIVSLIYIINTIVWRIIDTTIATKDWLSIGDNYKHYMIANSITNVLVLSLFYIMILLFYRRYKIITSFAFVSILTFIGFYALQMNTLYADPGSTFYRIMGSLSYFGSLINITIAFSINVQSYHVKIMCVSFMFFALFDYIFLSFYSQYFRGLLYTFFGPYAKDLATVNTTYAIIKFILHLGVGVLQGIVLHNLKVEIELDKEEEQILNTI